MERGAFVTADGWVTPCCTIKDGQGAGFGKLGEASAAELDAARRALAQELGEGRTPAPCQGCAIAAIAAAEPGAVNGPDPLETSVALEIEFSWVHSSWLALQRDVNRRLIPALSAAIVRLEDLRRRREEPAEAPDELAELRSRLEAAQEEHARLAAEVAASQARIAALRDSWSWRLAAPLRAGHRLLGLGRG